CLVRILHRHPGLYGLAVHAACVKRRRPTVRRCHFPGEDGNGSGDVGPRPPRWRRFGDDSVARARLVDARIGLAALSCGRIKTIKSGRWVRRAMAKSALVTGATG